MLAMPREEIRTRAESFLQKFASAELPGMEYAELRESDSQTGSGALPLEKLPSYSVCIKPKGSIAGFAKRLRMGNPPVVGIVRNEELALDFRTVFPDQEDDLFRALVKGLG